MTGVQDEPTIADALRGSRARGGHDCVRPTIQHCNASTDLLRDYQRQLIRLSLELVNQSGIRIARIYESPAAT